MIVTILGLNEPLEGGRVYSVEVVEEALKRRVPEYILFEPNNRSYGLYTIPLKDIAGKINRVFVEEDKLKADYEILATPMGNVLQKMLDENIDLYYYTSSIGKVGDDGRVDDLVINLVYVAKKVE